MNKMWLFVRLRYVRYVVLSEELGAELLIEFPAHRTSSLVVKSDETFLTYKFTELTIFIECPTWSVSFICNIWRYDTYLHLL